MRAGQIQLGAAYASQAMPSPQALPAAHHPPSSLPQASGLTPTASSIDGIRYISQSKKLSTSSASQAQGPKGAEAEIAKSMPRVCSASSGGPVADSNSSQPTVALKRSRADALLTETPSANYEPHRAHQLRRLGSLQGDGGNSISSPTDSTAAGRAPGQPSPRAEPRQSECRPTDPEPSLKAGAPLHLLSLSANALTGMKPSVASVPRAAADTGIGGRASLLSSRGIECLLTAAFQGTGAQLLPRDPVAASARVLAGAEPQADSAPAVAPGPGRWDRALPASTAPAPNHRQRQHRNEAPQAPPAQHQRQLSSTAVQTSGLDRGAGVLGARSVKRSARSTPSGSATEAGLARASSAREASGDGRLESGSGGGPGVGRSIREAAGSGEGSGRSRAGIAAGSFGRSGSRGEDVDVAADVAALRPLRGIAAGPSLPGGASGDAAAAPCTGAAAAVFLRGPAKTACKVACGEGPSLAATTTAGAQARTVQQQQQQQVAAGSLRGIGKEPADGDPPPPPPPPPTTATGPAPVGAATSRERDSGVGVGWRQGAEAERGSGERPRDTPSPPPGPLLPELPPELAMRLKKKVTIIQPISRAWEEETLQSSSCNATANGMALGTGGGGCCGAPGSAGGAVAMSAAASKARARGVVLRDRKSLRPPPEVATGAVAGRLRSGQQPARDVAVGSEAIGAKAVAGPGALVGQESLASGRTFVTAHAAPIDGRGLATLALEQAHERAPRPEPLRGAPGAAVGSLEALCRLSCPQPAAVADVAAPAAGPVTLSTPPEAIVAAAAAAGGAAPASITPHLVRQLSALAAVTMAYGQRSPQLLPPALLQQQLLLQPGQQAGLGPQTLRVAIADADAAKLGGLYGVGLEAARRPAAALVAPLDTTSPFDINCRDVNLLSLIMASVPGASGGSLLPPRHGSGTSTGATASTLAPSAGTVDVASAPVAPPAPVGVSDASPFGPLLMVDRSTSGTASGWMAMDDPRPFTSVCTSAAAAAGLSPVAPGLGCGLMGPGAGGGLSTKITAGASSVTVADARAEAGEIGTQPAPTAAVAPALLLPGHGPRQQPTACLGKIQGELTLLYQWYAANKKVYLDMAQGQLQRIEVLTAAVASKDGAPSGGGAGEGAEGQQREDPLAARVRAESAEALRAFETALKIMRVCDSVEQQWLAPAAGDCKPPPPPLQALASVAPPPQPPGAAAAAAVSRPQTASAAPSGAVAAGPATATAAAAQPAANDVPAVATLPLSGPLPAPSAGLTPGASAALAVAAALVGSVARVPSVPGAGLGAGLGRVEWEAGGGQLAAAAVAHRGLAAVPKGSTAMFAAGKALDVPPGARPPPV